MKKYLIIILIVISLISCVFGLVGCEKSIKETSDLIGIKINNFMAEWENPDFNFTYKGSNKLSVKVPYTNVLKVTDLFVSPNSEAKFYEDEAQTKEIINRESISIEQNKTLYIKVNHTKKKRLKTNYMLEVIVEDAKYIPEGGINKVPLNNPDGHIWIPDGVDIIIIQSEGYKVIRTIEDFQEIDMDMTAKYILNNEIDFKEETFITFGYRNKDNVNYNKTFYGNLNGNNYKVIINRYKLLDMDQDFKESIFWMNAGKIENIITDKENSALNCAGLANKNSGSIVNCVNKIDLKVIDPIVSYSQDIGGICSTTTSVAIRNCINYGNIECNYESLNFHVGGITGSYTGPTSNFNLVLNNNINVGNIKGATMAGGIVGNSMDKESIGYIKSNFYSYNLGDISSKSKKNFQTFGILDETNYVKIYKKGVKYIEIH